MNASGVLASLPVEFTIDARDAGEGLLTVQILVSHQQESADIIIPFVWVTWLDVYSLCPLSDSVTCVCVAHFWCDL